jgi:hypothetical protein
LSRQYLYYSFRDEESRLEFKEFCGLVKSKNLTDKVSILEMNNIAFSFDARKVRVCYL